MVLHISWAGSCGSMLGHDDGSEASTLPWLQGLAQCRNIVYMYATKVAM